jgi:hypothetical protein
MPHHFSDSVRFHIRLIPALIALWFLTGAVLSAGTPRSTLVEAILAELKRQREVHLGVPDRRCYLEE